MDRSLLKERAAFLKKAAATPSVDVKRKSEVSSKNEPPKKKPPLASLSPATEAPRSYKTMTGSSQYKFGILARIVRHMKSRHQEGETHPLSIDEILDETNQLNVGAKIKQWLLTDALPNNPKIMEMDGKYLFKPPLQVRDRKSLLKLLRQHDMKGLGGVLIDDIQESVPHYEKVMKHIDKDILKIRRQDKKQIIFYHDTSLKFEVDKEFQQLWRSTSVDGIQDDKIEEYLNKQGIKSMQDTGPKSLVPIRKKVKSKRQRATKISDNEHLADVLQNYDEL